MVRSGGLPTATANVRVVSQNVRGLLTQERKRKLIELTKRSGINVVLLQETWHVTPDGFEVEEFEGYIMLHHGETSKSCKRGRSGVAILLDKGFARAWEAGGNVHRKGFNGRVLSVDKPSQDGHTFVVATVYCPTLGASSLDRLACYDSIRSCTGHAGRAW